MGGLAGGRYIGPRGTTTGDATGGGGRSVMPNRDYLNMLAARRRRQMLRNQMRGSGGGGAPAIQGERGTLTPPGGGYSGGVIPRFQSGEQIAQMRAMQQAQNKSQRGLSPQDMARFRARIKRNQVLEARGLPPGEDTFTGFAGWEPHPRGGYSGGVIPRFQEGGQMQSLTGAPQAGGQHTFVRPMRVLMADGRYRTIQPEDIHAWNDRFVSRVAGLGAGSASNKARRTGTQARRQASRSPGGWQGGGAVGYSHGGAFPRHGSVSATPGMPGWMTTWKRGRTIGDLTGGGGRSVMPTHRSRGVPVRPPGGWQLGGQLEEPIFPVESELADESPWYPDEEVGYEEAVPMQGGFDIFGRGGG